MSKRLELKSGLSDILKHLSLEKADERKLGERLLDQAMKQFGPDAVMVFLRDLYPTATEPVRGAIVLALRHIEHPRSVEFVIEVLRDRRLARQLRIMGAETALRLGTPEAIDALFDALRGPEDFLKGPIIRAFSNAPEEILKRSIKKLFEKPEPMRDEIIRHAGEADHDAMTQWLLRSYPIMDEYRPDLARELEKIGAFARLVRAIAEIDWKRIREFSPLIQPGDSVGRKFMAAAVSKENPRIRWNALEVFSLLSYGEVIAETIETSVRWGVEEGLKKIAAMEQLQELSIMPRLQRFLGDPEQKQREEFSTAINPLFKIDVKSLFETFLQDPDSRVRARAAQVSHRLDPKGAVKSLNEMLDRKDPAMKRAAAQTMGALGLIDFAKPLAKYMNTDDSQLKERVNKALQRIQKKQKKSENK